MTACCNSDSLCDGTLHEVQTVKKKMQKSRKGENRYLNHKIKSDRAFYVNVEGDLRLAMETGHTAHWCCHTAFGAEPLDQVKQFVSITDHTNV